MDSVEISNCGQKDSTRAALRFDQAAAASSTISNSAIHTGLSRAITVKKSNSLKFLNNVFYNFRPIGANFESAINIEFSGNVMLHIVQDKADFEPRGGVLMCSNPLTGCRLM